MRLAHADRTITSRNAPWVPTALSHEQPGLRVRSAPHLLKIWRDAFAPQPLLADLRRFVDQRFNCARHGMRTTRDRTRGTTRLRHGSRHALLMPREAGCRKRPDREGEDFAELVDAVLHPLAPMLKRASRLAVLPAQPGAPNAARHAVVGARGAGRNQGWRGRRSWTKYLPYPASATSEKRPNLCREFPISDCPGLRDALPGISHIGKAPKSL